MEIERWDWTYEDMESNTDGAYVNYEDHLAATQELKQDIAHLYDRIDDLISDLEYARNN
jgi:hypothetical protein